MELNALDFVSKYKDLLTDGVVVDPVLDKAQSIFLNKMVVHTTSTIGCGVAHSFSLFGPSDVFKKTLTLFSLIGEEAPVAIKSDCFPLIKELTGLRYFSFDTEDEAWRYIRTLLGGVVLDLKSYDSNPRSADRVYLRIHRKMPPLLKSHKPKMFYDLWDELKAERYVHYDGVTIEQFFTTTPYYFLDYDDVRGVNINITRRGFE